MVGGILRRAARVLAALIAASGSAFGESAHPAPVVLLPLNVEEVPPEFLSHGATAIHEALLREAEARGHDHVRLSLVDAIRRWTDSVAAIGGLRVGPTGVEAESIDLARRELVDRLLREFGASAVFWPDLVVRKGRRRWGNLEWDGVNRAIPGIRRGWTSLNRGTSLRVRLFRRDGEIAYTEHYGLEVIDRTYAVKRASQHGWYRVRYVVVARSDLFEDAELIDEAVAGAVSQGWQ